MESLALTEATDNTQVAESPCADSDRASAEGGQPVRPEVLLQHILLWEQKVLRARQAFSARTFQDMLESLKRYHTSHAGTAANSRLNSLWALRALVYDLKDSGYGSGSDHCLTKSKDEQEEEVEKGVISAMAGRYSRTSVDTRDQQKPPHNTTAESGHVQAVPIHLYKYFKWFMDFTDYLRTMKQRFHKKVHCQLLLLPASELDGALPDSPLNETIEKVTCPVETLPPARWSPTDDFIERTLLALRSEYSHIATICSGRDAAALGRRLDRLCHKLDSLLREDNDLTAVLSKIPKRTASRKEVSGDDVYVHLVNSVFVKFKSLCDVSRRWLHTDMWRVRNLQTRLHELKKLHKAILVKKKDLDFAVNKHELELERLHAALNKLLRREERVNDLNTALFHNGESIAALREDLRSSRDARDKLASELLASPPPKDKYAELQRIYDRNRTERFVSTKRLQSKQYERKLLEQDLMLEADLRPLVVLATNNLQEQCEQLENLLEVERRQREQLANMADSLRQRRQHLDGRLLRHLMEGQLHPAGRLSAIGPGPTEYNLSKVAQPTPPGREVTSLGRSLSLGKSRAACRSHSVLAPLHPTSSRALPRSTRSEPMIHRYPQSTVPFIPSTTSGLTKTYTLPDFRNTEGVGDRTGHVNWY